MYLHEHILMHTRIMGLYSVLHTIIVILDIDDILRLPRVHVTNVFFFYIMCL